MHKLVVLRGNSGSGKTTVAKELQKVLGSNTMLISQDAIRRDMLNVSDGEDTLAIPLLMELLRYGTNIYAYYYDISFEETLKRHQTRSNRYEFGEEARLLIRHASSGKMYLYDVLEIKKETSKSCQE
ncbi:MAG: AAA family ATPase [Eubacteriales bacterium]|nr:AAA family ATPase [Eubacteriales bacterium]